MSLKGVFQDSLRKVSDVKKTYVIEISNFQWWITLKQNEKSSSEPAFCIFPFYLDNGTGKGLYRDVLLCIVTCLTPLRCRNTNITAGDTPHSLTFAKIWAPHSVRCCSLRLHIKPISCSHSISLRFHCGIRISPICTRIIFSSDWLVASPYQPRVLSAFPRLHWLSRSAESGATRLPRLPWHSVAITFAQLGSASGSPSRVQFIRITPVVTVIAPINTHCSRQQTSALTLLLCVLTKPE